MRKEVQEMFDAGKVTKDCIDWIRDFFEQNGQDCNAVVGISGGKDSSVEPLYVWKHWEKSVLSES